MLNLDDFLGDVCVHEHDLKDIRQSSMINYIYIALARYVSVNVAARYVPHCPNCVTSLLACYSEVYCCESEWQSVAEGHTEA